jgi:hypothetical protein
MRVVTVQVIKTGRTPQLAPADHVRAAEQEQRHPAEQLHTRWGGTPRRCAAVASTSTPRSSDLPQRVRPLHSACPSCPGATAHRDGSTAPPCCGSGRRLRLARTSTTPHAVSGWPGTSRRSWAHHRACPLPITARPLGAAGSWRRDMASGSRCPGAPDATTETSGAPAPARRPRAPLRAPHGRAALHNPAAPAPSPAAATAPETSWRPSHAPSPRCRQTVRPTARGPRGPRRTAAPQTPSPHASRPPITPPAGHPDARGAQRGGPPLARGRRGERPLRARRPPRSWPAPRGRASPHASGRHTPRPSWAAACVSTSATTPSTTTPWPGPWDPRGPWAPLRARARA